MGKKLLYFVDNKFECLFTIDPLTPAKCKTATVSPIPRAGLPKKALFESVQPKIDNTNINVKMSSQTNP